MRSGLASRAVVAALAVAVLAPNHPAGRVPGEDAGVFFYVARTLLEGGTPYVDVWDHKPPLVYLIDALGLAMGGLAGVWAVQVVALVSAAVLSLAALTRAFGVVAATVGTIAWLVAAPRLFLAEGEQSSYVEFFVLPLQFGALAFVAARPDVRFRRAEALALGVLAGLAALLKPTLVAVWIALGLVLLWRHRRDAVTPLTAMAAGAAAVIGLVALFFAARGALGEMIEQALRYNVAYASFTPPVERLGAIPEGFRLLSPSGLAPLAFAVAAYAVVRRRAIPSLLLVALVALPLELLLATSGRGYHYYFLPWLATFGVLAAFAASEVLRVLDARRAVAVLAVAVLAMSVQPARLVTRLAVTGDDGMVRAVAAYLTARTSPGDTVFVWGSKAEVLTVAERRSPTRYVFQYAPLATRGYATPAAVDALLRDLTARPPALILDASAASFVTPPLDREGLRSWSSPESQYAWPPETERVLAFVEAGYVRDATVPGAGWPVWRRR